MTDAGPADDKCACCECFGAFGYRNTDGSMSWYCEQHRRGQYYADARRDLKTSNIADDSDPPKPPDLQDWIARFGGHRNIPWDQWDTAVEEYQIERRIHMTGYIAERPEEPRRKQRR